MTKFKFEGQASRKKGFVLDDNWIKMNFMSVEKELHDQL